MTDELTVSDARLTLCDVHGPLSDLLQKLNGAEGDVWNEALKRMLRKENPWEIRNGIYRTVRTGLYKTAPRYSDALRKAKVAFDTNVGDLLESTQFSIVAVEHEIKIMPMSDFGFTKLAHYRDVCFMVEKEGYSLCSVEEGVALRIHYAQEQPLRTGILVVMEPFVLPHKRGSHTLVLGKDGNGTWLSCHDFTPHYYHFDPKDWHVAVKVVK
jgi:hypothetical protein